MTNPGAQLAALRPMTEKPCDVCGALFKGLERKKTCEKCRNQAKANDYNKRKKSSLDG